MKLKYEKKIIDSFHDQVTVSYCGFQVSRIVEKGIRKRLRGANLKSSALDFDGVLRKAADRLSRARRLVRPREEALPWSPGDTLFVCHNETAFGGVLPLIDEMTTQKVACTVILPEEARNWASSRASVEDVKWVFGASLRETPVSGEIKAVVRAFKKQASAFLVQHQLRGAGPLRSDMVAHAKHALTRIELIRGWIKRAEPDRIVVSQPKEEPLYHSLAGRLEGVPTVIVPHGVLRGGDVFRPAFYDLGLFDIGLVRSHRCAEIAQSLNPNIRTIVTGFSGLGSRSDHRRAPVSPVVPDEPGQEQRRERLQVGMAADKDLQDVKDVAAAAARADVPLLVKGRPPGGDSDLLKEALGAHGAAKALPHEAISLHAFLASVTGVICTRSNVAFHAAARGVPVIYWRGVKAQQTAAGPRSVDRSHIPKGLGVEDIALESPRDLEELVDILAKWHAAGPEALDQRRQMQIERYARWFPLYNPPVIVRSLLS